ncbi:MAG: hypothetical protein JST14_15170 [Bacteroidetes bacterium]|nr:hypothetical protein [Bacteroidota bacterium]MBS1976223.1 hypothetical protein [Bacteroidota bacterium]
MLHSPLRLLLLAIIMFLFLTPLESLAQFSFGLEAGTGINTDNSGPLVPYALSTQWPLKSSTTSTEGDALWFYDKGSALSISGIITWEASAHFGLSAVFRSLNWTMNANHRTSSMNSVGLQFKFNFVRNTKKFVPFAQAEFMAINSNHLSQQKAASPTYPQQVQPAFEQSFTTNLGVGLDLGGEISISQPFSIVLKGGLHGVQIAVPDKDKDFTRSLDYGVYLPPGGLDGVVFAQLTAGIKYYTGRTKKKRDY